MQLSEDKLDCRGLACPGPVLKTRELVEHGTGTGLRVLVDNAAARENVSRFLGRMGYQVRVLENDGHFEVVGVRDSAAAACEVTEPYAGQDQELKIAVVVGNDCMGKGDDVLGSRLMFNFLATMKELGSDLWRLIFLNGGVKLAVEGSESLPVLRELDRNGVSILVCGTCLNHFGLLEKKQVGETTNMLDIVTALQLADKVISVM